MNWDQVETQWQLVKDKLKSGWATWTKEHVGGSSQREVLGRVETQFGEAKETVEPRVDG